MGVTNRSEIVCKRPDSASSTESLHIPQSSSESSINTVEEDPAQITATTSTSRTVISSRLNLGRRKLRRLRAVRELEVLVEEDETEQIEDGITHHTPFTDILTDPQTQKVWDEFTAKDEDTQNKILESDCTKKKISTIAIFTPSLKNMSQKLRIQIEAINNITVLETVEKELREFFCQTPENIYFGKGKTSYERLLIHGVAQYYGLNSNSINGANHTKIIRVSNPSKKPISPGYSLVKEIQEIENNK